MRITKELQAYVDKLSDLSLRAQLVQTGHPDYIRGYIIKGDNVRIGRMVIFKGAYQWVKWYAANEVQYRKDLHYNHKLALCWDCFTSTGYMVSAKQYLLAIDWAEKDQALDLKDKREWRYENPLPCNPNGKQRTRPRLQQKNIYRLIAKQLVMIATNELGD